MTQAFITHPPVVEGELRAHRLPDGSLDSAFLSKDWIRNQDGSDQFKKIVATRLAGETICNTEDQVLCYRTSTGVWVPELRDETKSYRFDSLLSLPRVIAFGGGQVGERTLLRASDFETGPEWSSQVAFFERRGISVAAQTNDNPDGYFAAAAVSRDGIATLVGYQVAAKKVEAILLTNIGRTLVSRVSEVSKIQELGLRHVHTHNVGAAFCDQGEWSETYVLPSGDFAVTIANCTAMQYAQSCFEGLVAVYDGQGQASIFGLPNAARRFAQSCRSLQIPPISEEQFIESVIHLVKRNLAYLPLEKGKLYIRPSMHGMEGGAGANSATKFAFILSVFPFGDYMSGKDEGIQVEGQVQTHRPATGATKVAPNYAPTFRHKVEAKKRGINDILSFSTEGNVEELTTSAVFFVRRTGEALELVTSPVLGDEHGADSHSLTSITRAFLIELARAEGISVAVKPIHYSELGEMCAAFSVGTAMGITRIGKLDLVNEEPVGSFDYNSDQQAKELIVKLQEQLRLARGGLLEGGLAYLNDKWTIKIPYNILESN